MLHKRLADKIKSGMAWSVISEEGERIPTSSNAKDGESNHGDQPLCPLNIVSPEIEKIQEEIAIGETRPLMADAPPSMEKMLDNSERKFKPEFLLKKPEKEEPVVKESPVKRPTAAFRAASDQNSESSEVSAIKVPNELVRSCELLADSVISMSVSVLSAEKACVASPKRGDSVSDRERSIEFKSYASKELKSTG